MSSKLEDARKEIPIRGRNGILKLWALLEEDFFGWDSFSLRYGLVDGEGVIPEETELQHTHDYDQILWFLSGDPEDMLHLGAELEVDLGAEGIRHRFATPHAVIVPKGVPHFSPRVHRLDRPFYFLSVNLCGKLKAEIADENARPETGPWSRFFGEFSRQIRPLSFSANEPYHYGSERQQPSGGVSTFLGSDAAGLPVTMAWSTVCRDHPLGPWGPDGKHHPHAHPDYNEALIFLSLDQDNLTELHCQADYTVGEDGPGQEHCILTRATVMAMKQGVAHLTLVYREVTAPSVFITLGNH